jgi:hypothetical protein
MKFLYRSLRKFDVILTLNRNRPSRTVGEYIMITIESYLPLNIQSCSLFAKAIILSTLPISSNTDLEYRTVSYIIMALCEAILKCGCSGL